MAEAQATDVRLVLLRHAPTAWNEAQRIQGRTDTPLSDAGRRQAGARVIPHDWQHLRWYCSPLQRTVETARLRGITEWRVDDRLIEMSWGEYEGQTVPALRQRYGATLANNEARGLDFRPPGGESPRDVQARALAWTLDVLAAGNASGAVTHKGVIRALLAAAWNWDMLGPPPVAIDWRCAHVLRITPGDSLTVDELNVSLVRADSGA